MPNGATSIVLRLALAATPLACAGAQQPVQQEARCLVRQVADGDSFRCSDGRRVRLIGIDSPERDQRPFGSEAQHALLRLLPRGSGVTLEYDRRAHRPLWPAAGLRLGRAHPGE